MIGINRPTLIVAALCGLAVSAHAQIPDLLSAFDAGGRSLGLGSSIGATGSGTSATLNNPAGLGYSTTRQFGFTLRNLSESRTRLSRSFIDPDFDTDGQSGRRSLTHVGYVMPMGGRGVIGLSYEVGGFINDTSFGTNLLNGEVNYRNYVERIYAKTDFFTLSWGRASSDYTRSFGVGVVLANTNIRNEQDFQIFSNNGTPTNFGDDSFISTETLDNSGSGFGVGVVAGIQVNPSPDLTLGASIRTPISLNTSDEVSDYYDTIPGRVSVGAARRLSRGGDSQDFLLLGGQVDWFFGGKSAILDRDDSQLALGFGVEYNYRFRDAFLPIRVGFRNIAKGGEGFKQNSAFTFGIGYNPDGRNFGLNLDFGQNSTGARDISLSLSYRFKN